MRKVAWLSWDKACQEKSVGELGIKICELSNLGLLMSKNKVLFDGEFKYILSIFIRFKFLSLDWLIAKRK